MLHLSMPLRPRINVRCEYLLTPISISKEKEGRKILCLSDIKSEKNFDHSKEYIDIISNKMVNFDLIIKDSDDNLVKFARQIIIEKLLPYREVININTCLCGAYEELENTNSFDLRRVKDNVCIFCGQSLKKQKSEVLLSNIIWPKKEDFSYHYTWSGLDIVHFLGRQKSLHKISKRSEPLKISVGNLEFGIRYQVLWATMIVYIANIENDYDLTMHYVNKVQDKAFFVCSLAKIMCPCLNFNLKAIPIVWIDDSPIITECLNSHVKLLGNALNTKRKELRVSLKNWRY